MPAAPLGLVHDTFRIGDTFNLTFERTVRLPVDDKTYPLPPGFGAFPVVARDDGFMIPMHDREATWLLFGGQSWRPVAVKVGVGGVNAITGEPFDLELRPGRQDYMVVPDQPWLDGIKAGDGFIRQFVAAPLGQGHSVEAQITGAESKGGIQVAVFQPMAGRFPDVEPRRGRSGSDFIAYCQPGVLYEAGPRMMGMGAGGRMRQRIYPDAYGIESWDAAQVEQFEIRLVHASDWKSVTGVEAPPSPINAQTYIQLGLPWFGLADENKGDVPTAPVLAGVKALPVPDDLPVIILT